MIAGRKLLLADDSVAIQKVIDLTFTDEGMEVTIVGDGQDALAKLEQVTPDVVLADIFMPGLDGYELCKFIKHDERLRDVPVMLLVGSFEPFDQDEAERAGADDVVTKPFQSIRDLVSRVGSLIGGDAGQSAVVEPDERETQAAHVDVVSELFAEPDGSAEHMPTAEEPHVKVFVEAPMMESLEPDVVPEHTCPPDIDLQTADTQQLDPVHPNSEFDDTVEVEVLAEEKAAEFTASNPNAEAATPSAEQRDGVVATGATAFDADGVLDLGDVDSFATATVEDDFELDLDVEPIGASMSSSSIVNDSAPAANEDGSPSLEEEDASATAASVQATVTEVSPGQLSPEAIEAISQRVVEKLSDQVVREIAWEVVPELSELLIKKQLQERG